MYLEFPTSDDGCLVFSRYRQLTLPWSPSFLYRKGTASGSFTLQSSLPYTLSVGLVSVEIQLKLGFIVKTHSSAILFQLHVHV